MAIILLVTSHTGFINDFNGQAHKLYGTTGNAYAATVKAGTAKAGYVPTSVGHFNFSGVLC